MTWTRERLEEIPEIYRDFLLTLKPILETRDKVQDLVSRLEDRLERQQEIPVDLGNLFESLSRPGHRSSSRGLTGGIISAQMASGLTRKKDHNPATANVWPRLA